MSRPLRLGLSTCPNDTFAFHALLTGAVATPGLELDFRLDDVEALNEAMLAGELDVSKVSFHAALTMAERVLVLPSGSALGFGVSPLVLGAPGHPRPQDWSSATPPRVLTPGRWTTAHLLWRLFHPEDARLEPVLFADIPPALARGEADYGVCIHEARFTWHETGLERHEDLGETWEAHTGAALPLGGIVARRDLEADVLARVAAAVHASIEWGLTHRAACLPTMRRWAQEQTDEILWSHVDLYVNEWTVELGEVGRTALEALAGLARERGLLAAEARLAIL